MLLLVDRSFLACRHQPINGDVCALTHEFQENARVCPPLAAAPPLQTLGAISSRRAEDAMRETIHPIGEESVLVPQPTLPPRQLETRREARLRPCP